MMKQKLIDYWQVGVQASLGETTVFDAIKRENITDVDVFIAIGKAASSMALGALKAIGNKNLEGLIVTKYGHGLPELDSYPHVTLLEAAHPIPDVNSLLAGAAVVNKVKSLDGNSRLLFLVSGGASALVEHLAEDLSLFELQTLNIRMMAEGLAIEDMNKQRRKLSEIKFGKLLKHFKGAKLDILAVSDVEGDEISVIGSGIGFYDHDLHLLLAEKPEVNSQIVASNALARQAIELAIIADGMNVVCNEECLYDEVFTLAERLSNRIIDGDSGAYIFGGEPTIHLPPLPGNGGRNQSLGLAMAAHIYGRTDIKIIVAGTDGTDGPTDAAGALIDGATFIDAAAAKTALEKANAGDYLAKHDALFKSGPTGTNVMDIIIAIKN